MAVPILWILLLTVSSALCSGPDPTPECTAVCQDGFCPVKLTLIDSEECVCRLMFMTHFISKGTIRLTCKNDSVEIRLPKRFRPERESMLVIKGQEEPLTCYKVNLTATASNLEDKNKTNKKVKIQCTKKDQILVQSVFVVNGNKRYGVDPTKRSVTGCRRIDESEAAVSSKIRDSKGCKCWSPNQVRIHPVGNSTLIVEWEPFYAHKDVRVRIESVESQRSKDDRDETLYIYKLCDKKLRNFTFTNFDPGTYVAMVGALGCSCMLYTQSDRITIGEGTKVTNTLKPVPGPSEDKDKDKDKDIRTVQITIVVGVLVIICTVFLGLFYYFKRRGNGTYDLVRREPNETNITILLDKQDELTNKTATCIKGLLKQPHIKIKPKEGLGNTAQPDQLLVLVSLQDVHTFQEPAIDEHHKSCTITVLRNYINDPDPENDPDSNLVVHLPGNTEHSCFKSSRNETRGTDRVISLRDALGLVNAKCDFDGDEYKDLMRSTIEMMKSRDDEIKNIHILSGKVHEHHTQACLGLVKILQQLGKIVTYAHDESNRKDIQAEGPLQWTLNKLDQANLVVVVASKFLYKLIDCYNRAVRDQDISQNLGICAPFAMRQLMQRINRPKIAYVSFGYESESVDNIVKLYRRLDSDMRYNLVETKHPVNTRNEYGENHALAVFLSRLSSNRTLVQNTCENSDAFFQSVREMATTLVNKPKGTSEFYGSKESLLSL